MTRRTLPPRRRLACVVEPLEARLTFAVFTVSTIADGAAGSLRQAIVDANASQGPDTIVFDPVFFSTPRTITIVNAPQQIGGPVTITGPGASLLTVRRDGSGLANTRRVFDSVASSLTLSGMTVTGGAVSGANGGGISAVGVSPNVTLDNMVITGNSTDGLGGGVYVGNGGTLTLRNSLISGNTGASGGGLYFFSTGSLVMENSTITGNHASAANNAAGGGLYFAGAATSAPPAGFTPGTLVVRNSTIDNNTSAGLGGGVALATFTGTLLVQNATISGNTAATSGGGISANAGAGALTLQNSTITANTANGTAATAGGGGIFRTSTFNNIITIVNSIVSGNTNPGGGAPDIRVDPFSTTNVNSSAVGVLSGFTLSNTSGNNLPFNANLMLAPLANNGGPTRTHAFAAASPLLNAGSNNAVPAGVTTDQRGAGFARIVGGTVDIGAVERETVPPAVTAADFTFARAPQSLRFTFNKNVMASLAVGDLVLTNKNKGADVPAANIALAYDPGANVATFTFPGYPHGALPDGNYVAKLTASGITDASGLPMTNDYLFGFFFMNADATHDRKVDFSDLVKLAQNYNAANKTFPEGDFNYDGSVNFSDLVILAQRYNTTLPIPPGAGAAVEFAPAPAAPPLTATDGETSLFSATPIAKPLRTKPKVVPRLRAR